MSIGDTKPPPLQTLSLTPISRHRPHFMFCLVNPYPYSSQLISLPSTLTPTLPISTSTLPFIPHSYPPDNPSSLIPMFSNLQPTLTPTSTLPLPKPPPLPFNPHLYPTKLHGYPINLTLPSSNLHPPFNNTSLYTLHFYPYQSSTYIPLILHH